MVRLPIACIVIFYVISSALLVVGCGGGGGESSKTTNDPPPSGILNPNLSGKLLFEHEDNAWLMDVSSGSYSKIPNTYWVGHDNIFGSSNYFWLHTRPDPDDRFIVTSLENCDTQAGANKYYICVGIQNFDGNYLSSFKFYGKSKSAAKLSLDNQYFAIMNEDPLANETELQIYDMGGQLVSNRVVTAGDFEWLSDNRIIYTSDRKFNITYELSANPHEELTLPNGMEGKIGSVEVSPTGDKFVFSLITSGTLVSTHATPWIVNIDGSGLRQLAVTPSSSSPPSITSARWSPDGKWILLREGEVTGADPLNPGSLGYGYVVPAQDMGKTFVLSIIDEKRSTEVRLLNRYETIDTTPSGGVVQKFFSDTPSWIP
jgi:hypothetical protein